jgi:hypothetical protein
MQASPQAKNAQKYIKNAHSTSPSMNKRGRLEVAGFGDAVARIK